MKREQPIIVIPPSRHETVVHERVVPIDASHAATLLRDVEDKARERITQAVTIEGNGFNALLQVERENHTDRLRGYLTFDINGARHVIDESVPMSRSIFDLSDKLFKSAADKIAVEIVGPAVAKAMKGFR